MNYEAFSANAEGEEGDGGSNQHCSSSSTPRPRREECREEAELLPPIIVARDGYHRWQAHVRETREEIQAENKNRIAARRPYRSCVRSIHRNAGGMRVGGGIRQNCQNPPPTSRRYRDLL
jgi:hypothetical protein